MRNFRELSSEEVEHLKALYPVTTTRELSKMFDISIESIHKKAYKNGWKKDTSKVCIGNRNGHSLTENEIGYIIKHYKHTKNQDLMDRFGIGETQLYRIARLYSLKKSSQFINKTRKVALKAGTDVIMEYDLMPKGVLPESLRKYHYCRKGISNVKYFGRKKWDGIKIKIRNSINKTIRRERARITFGLPQKTKLKLTSSGEKARSHRHLFKKKGYIVGRGSTHIYWDDNTERSIYMEQNARQYGLIVEPYGQTKRIADGTE
jgi:hypothetical protein